MFLLVLLELHSRAEAAAINEQGGKRQQADQRADNQTTHLSDTAERIVGTGDRTQFTRLVRLIRHRAREGQVPLGCVLVARSCHRTGVFHAVW